MCETQFTLQTNKISKSYGSHRALEECSLSVSEGEVFGLLGPNGAGKTTLLRLLMGFLKPTSGSAQIEQLDCYHDSVEVHRRVSYLPGEVRFYSQKKGSDIVRLFSKLRGTYDPQKIVDLAQRLDLDLSRRVAFMSTGMRQKLGLIVTFSCNTPLLILDEPTSNLDPTIRSTVLKLVSEAQQAGRTILFSSHVLSEVEEISDRVAILRNGHLVHTQVIADLKGQHLISARCTKTLPTLPQALLSEVQIQQNNGQVQIETKGDLSHLFQWLMDSGVKDVSIQPTGLQRIYEIHQKEN